LTNHFAKSSVTISGVLIGHVQWLHRYAVEEVTKREGAVRPDGSHYTTLAWSAIILAASSVEAFVNEVFLSSFGEMVLGVSLLREAGEPLERLDIPAKLLLLPHVAFGRSLEAGKQPYQDMVLLSQLRNELVHYKMGDKPPNAVNVLARRGIAVRVPPEQEAGGPHAWAERLCRLEVVQWAHNSACDTVGALVSLVPEDKRRTLDALVRSNFQPIAPPVATQ